MLRVWPTPCRAGRKASPQRSRVVSVEGGRRLLSAQPLWRVARPTTSVCPIPPLPEVSGLAGRNLSKRPRSVGASCSPLRLGQHCGRAPQSTLGVSRLVKRAYNAERTMAAPLSCPVCLPPPAGSFPQHPHTVHVEQHRPNTSRWKKKRLTGTGRGVITTGWNFFFRCVLFPTYELPFFFSAIIESYGRSLPYLRYRLSG